MTSSTRLWPKLGRTGTADGLTERAMMDEASLEPQAVLRAVADYLVDIQTPLGFCAPQHTEYTEKVFYHCENIWSLLQAYLTFDDVRYLRAAEKGMEFLSRQQSPDGGFPDAIPVAAYQAAGAMPRLFLYQEGKAAPGAPDPFAALSALYYERVTGDVRYRAVAEAALNHFEAVFDPDDRSSNSLRNRVFSLAFALIAFDAWHDVFPSTR